MFIVKTIHNFLSKKECENIINEQNLNELIDAGVGIKREIKKNIRDSKIKFVDNDYIKDKLISELEKSISLKGYKVAVVNQFQFTKYETGGYYDWHMDYNPAHERFNKRFFSTVIQLNDDYDGGELVYRDTAENEIIFEKGLGNLYLFSSSIYHKVNKVTRNNRFSLVNWLSVEEIRDYKKTLL